MSDRVQGTCAWSIQSVPYSEWIHDKQSTILWITGDAGCGKTTLTSFVIETLSRELDSATIKETTTSLVCYFFCSRNVQEPADACSILRGLILQLLVSSKDVVKRVRAVFSTAKQCFDQSYESLWKILCYAAELVRYDVLYLVIDGLDECEVKSKERFLRSVSQMLDLYNHSNGLLGKRVKFLVTGQPDTIRFWTAIANRSRHYHLSMESRPQAMVEDVMNFINNKVDELVAMRICTITSADALRQSLHQLAGNSFLWASVVLEQCRISLELTPNSFPQLVSSIPADLKEAYMRYLPEVPQQGIAVLQKYIQLLVACRRPLTLEEIATCMVSGHSHSIDDIKRTQNTVIESSLQRAFGPLVRISQGQIFFAHTTVRDYLVDIGAEKSHPLHDTHGVNMRGAHLTLAIACMKCLSLDDFSHDLFTIQDSQIDNSLSSTDSNAMDQRPVNDIDDTSELFGIHDVTFLKDEDSIREISCEKIKASFEFYDYAAVNWTYHYACSEAAATEEVVRLAIELSAPQSAHFENWYKYAVARSRTSMPELSELDSVTVAALFGHSMNLRSLLSDTSDGYAQDYTAAIFWAASKGHAEVVRTLIEHDIDPNKTQNGQTPLAIAIQAGHIQVCTILLGYSGTDPNSAEMRGAGPLSLAAAYNHREILDLLLAQKGIEINRENHLGCTALIEASSNGSLECLEILLRDGRSSLNHQDGKGQNALIHAIRNGSHSTCSLLLRSPGFQGHLTDFRGRNAMSHAAEGGDLRIVQLLWRRKISISDQDHDGRNAISWAANSARATKTHPDGRCALRFLVENSQHSVDLVDHNGWTPLAWAMDPPGYLEAVKILIGYGRVDVNQCDGTRGRPVLSWAASEGFLDITRFLLKTSGIKKNQMDHDGRTPISYAAGSGHIDIVNLLAEDSEVLLDMQDSAGRTALDWAVLGRHDAVAEKLQHYLQIRS
jgi:ankyrin repeat protein